MFYIIQHTYGLIQSDLAAPRWGFGVKSDRSGGAFRCATSAEFF